MLETVSNFGDTIATTELIDTHVHFWQYDAKSPDFAWITDEMKILRQDYLPENFPLATANTSMEIPNHRCIAVQARESMEETMFLLAHAATNPMIAGVVGWVDWNDLEVEKQYAKLRKFKKLKGFRHIIQDKPKGFMRNVFFAHAIAMLGTDFTYDLLIKPHLLAEAWNLVNDLPSQPFVINHIAKPDIKGQQIEKWKNDIQKFKPNKNVSCKLSGMVTEAHWKQWKAQDFKEVLAVVYETFGADRLMYGSDWPVCLLASDYKGVYHLVNDFISTLSVANQNKIRYKNAVKFYNL